jgi:uncharacterized membrane protein
MRVLLLGEIEFTSNYYRKICDLNGWILDYTLSHIETESLDPSYDLYILSDYPYSKLRAGVDKKMVEMVQVGKGLLMVGGWSSFTGLNGEYQNSVIEDILPVKCKGSDDRVNVWGGLHLRLVTPHPIVSNLDWERPPVICGYNEIIPQDDGTVVVEAQPIYPQGDIAPNIPMLAVTTYGHGRVSAYLSDLVPHWCGGLVDWGEPRVEKDGFEFGLHYVTFVSQLMAWTAGQITNK